MLRRNIHPAGRRSGRREDGAAAGRRLRAWAITVICLLLTAHTLVWLDGSIRPVMLSNAQYECERIANAAFQTALARQEPETYTQLYELSRGADGQVHAVLLDGGRIAQLEAALAEQIRAELERRAVEQTMSLPLSVLLGGNILAGPRLAFELSPDAFVSVDVYETWEDAGINQTRLCLRARFTAQMSAVLAGYGVNADAQQEALLAEFVLAGDVPQVYLENDMD